MITLAYPEGELGGGEKRLGVPGIEVIYKNRS